MNGNTPFKINIPREDAFIDIRDSYLEMEVHILKNADDTRYADGNYIQPNNLFGISLFREMTLSGFGSKRLERVDNVYLASLMYKLLSDNEEDMIIVYKKETAAGIDTTKRNRLLNDTPEKGTIFVRVYLKDVFGFVNHTDKINYGMGYSLTLKRADNGNSIFRDAAVDECKIKIEDIVWFVRHDTPSFENVNLVTEHVLAKQNTEYSYVSRSITQKPINSNNNWIMEIGTESGTDVPIYVIVGFQTAARAGPNQTQNNAIFDSPDIIEASCNIGTVRYPDNE